MRRRAVVLTLVLAAVVIAGIAAALRILIDAAATSSDEQPAALEWSGPVRRDGGRMVVQLMAVAEDGTLQWAEAREARRPTWVDITDVQYTGNPNQQLGWTIELAGVPPRAAGLDRAEWLIAYGLVLETTGDGIADYVVGINNDAPRPGDFRVWVTALATGHTEEQVGAPYGFPIEFSHPDERRPGHAPRPRVYFTFLGGSAPQDLNASSVRFYAWASVAEAGKVVAWDYAPDAWWLGAPPGLEE